MTEKEWAAAIRERFASGQPAQRARAVIIATLNPDVLAKWIVENAD